MIREKPTKPIWSVDIKRHKIELARFLSKTPLMIKEQARYFKDATKLSERSYRRWVKEAIR